MPDSLAADVLRLLAELWLDQHGMTGTVRVIEKQSAA